MKDKRNAPRKDYFSDRQLQRQLIDNFPIQLKYWMSLETSLLLNTSHNYILLLHLLFLWLHF